MVLTSSVSSSALPTATSTPWPANWGLLRGRPGASARTSPSLTRASPSASPSWSPRSTTVCWNCSGATAAGSSTSRTRSSSPATRTCTADQPFGAPFVHAPATPQTKPKAQARLAQLLRGRPRRAARHMKIVTPGLLAAVGAPLINIHHSFLSLRRGGALPQAKERGVKSRRHRPRRNRGPPPGPDDPAGRRPVDHRHSTADLVRLGADVERALSRAVLAPGGPRRPPRQTTSSPRCASGPWARRVSRSIGADSGDEAVELTDAGRNDNAGQAQQERRRGDARRRRSRGARGRWGCMCTSRPRNPCCSAGRRSGGTCLPDRVDYEPIVVAPFRLSPRRRCLRPRRAACTVCRPSSRTNVRPPNASLDDNCLAERPIRTRDVPDLAPVGTRRPWKRHDSRRRGRTRRSAAAGASDDGGAPAPAWTRPGPDGPRRELAEPCRFS